MLYPILGTAALGVSAAAYGLVFGILVLRCLGLVAALGRDLATCAALAALYVLVWAFAPSAVAAHAWLPLAASALYWVAAAAVVPRCRAVVQQAWWSFRAV